MQIVTFENALSTLSTIIFLALLISYGRGNLSFISANMMLVSGFSLELLGKLSGSATTSHLRFMLVGTAFMLVGLAFQGWKLINGQPNRD